MEKAKRLINHLSLVLFGIIACISLTACPNPDPDPDEPEIKEPSLIGIWLADRYNNSWEFKANGELVEYAFESGKIYTDTYPYIYYSETKLIEIVGEEGNLFQMKVHNLADTKLILLNEEGEEPVALTFTRQKDYSFLDEWKK